MHLKELDIELFHLELRQYYLQIARKKNLTASEFWTLVRPYSDLQKHESSCLLSGCFSCISPEPLELQKIFLRLFASLSEGLSDEKRIF